MKKPQTGVARRVATSTTGLALAVSAVLAGGGVASAAPGDDLVGTVTGATGAPLAGTTVEAWTTPGDGTAPKLVSTVVSDANGAYAFPDLDPAALAARPGIAGETEFKLFFFPDNTTSAAAHTTGSLARGLGGSLSVRNAGSAIVPAGGTGVAKTQALPAAAGLLVRLVGVSGAPLTGLGSALAFDTASSGPLDALAAQTSTTGDDDFYAPGPAPADGLVYVQGLEPGSFTVLGQGVDYDAATTVTRPYLSRFFGGDGSYAGASPVTATAGAFTPVTIRLSDVLTNLERPTITGNSVFGATLKASPGTWLAQRGTEFTYQWLRGSTVVGTASTYRVTKRDKKARLRVNVTAVSSRSNIDPYEFVGSASSAPTSKVGEKSKVTARRSGDGFAVSVSVAKKKLAKKLGTPTGKIVLYTLEGEVASKKVALKGAKASIAPKSRFAAEKKFVVAYLGGGKLGSDTANATLGGGGKKKS